MHCYCVYKVQYYQLKKRPITFYLDHQSGCKAKMLSNRVVMKAKCIVLGDKLGPDERITR